MGARPLAVASAALAAGALAGISWSTHEAGAAALLAFLGGGFAWVIGRRLRAKSGVRSSGQPDESGPLSPRAKVLRFARSAAIVCFAFALGLVRGAVASRPAVDPALFAWLQNPAAAHGGREPIWIEARVEETAFASEGARILLAVDARETSPGSAWGPASPDLRAVVSGPRSLHRGDRLRALARLHLPEPQQNPGGRDLHAELARRGASLAGSLDEHALVLLSRGPWIFRALDGLRDQFAHRCAELCTTPQRAALVSALGVGDRQGLDIETDEELTDSGLIHLLSSAGLHLAIAALLAREILRAILLRIRWTQRRRASAIAALAALPFVAAEVLLLGAPWPAVRAGFAAGLALSAPLLSRRFDSLTGLIAGVALCGLWDPASLSGMPLLLSFAGVLGLIILAPRLRELIPLRPPPPGATLRAHPFWVAREEMVRLFCASLAASLCTAPWMAAAFHRVSIVSALANAIGLWPGLCALPIASVAVPLDAVAPSLALPFFWASDGLAALVLFAAHVFSRFPVAAIAIPAPGFLGAALWSLSLLLLAGWPAPLGAGLHALRPRPRILLVRAAIPLALLAVVSLGKSVIARVRGDVEVVFLSVGQGDSAIVRFPDGSTVLVDGGGDLRDLPAPHGSGRIDPGTRDVLPALAELGVSRINLMVLSHPHPDHAGGLFAVLRAMPVDELWLTGEPGPNDIGGKLEHAARERGVRVRVPSPGEEWTRGDARIEVLAPDPRWRPDRSTNDNSIVLRVVHKEVALLLAGDVEALTEAELAQGTRPLRAQLLKAGHHGSRTSSTDAFLRAVNPPFVVFSVGAQNPFGFPHSEVVQAVESLGARAFRTDQGAVIAESDGKTLRVRSFAPP